MKEEDGFQTAMRYAGATLVCLCIHAWRLAL